MMGKRFLSVEMVRLAKIAVGKTPRKYTVRSVEEEMLKWWEKKSVYRKTRNQGKGRKKFYFLDGPPYVTNPPHVGTAWNKLLKDVVVRYKRMRGFDVRDQPGYDCHGLPIEVKVEEDLQVRSKKEIEDKITVEVFIERCKQYAEQNVKTQTSVFKNLGVWMDWDHPYLTYTNDYIESVWWTVKRADERGLLRKGLRVVHWCPRCETALAGYEATDEYRTVKDRSIYVKFPVEGKEKEFILIWTTTPWTIPANVAVMVHPDESYVRARLGDEVYILAEARCKALSEQLGRELEILESFRGDSIVGLRFKPPLLEEVPVQSKLENAHRVVPSRQYVTMMEGTGCVHSAPGHGEEDFEVGLEQGLPVLCPVDQTGRFTEEAGKYKGEYVTEANDVIVEDLRKKGLLLFDTIVEHSYPHCWRCKTPLIQRATEQWFLKITDIKGKLLEENEKIRWVPEWAGKKRFADWLMGARDWVISRQRFWGAPLPIWICEKCEMRIVVGSRSELETKAVEFPKSLDLHRQCVDKIELRCDCGGSAKRIPDIVDVWMDSGIASWACLEYPRDKRAFQSWWPADFITEAHDQTRGWFYTQLGSSMVTFEKSPYQSVLMHGHTLDTAGQKMSKSLGNFVSPDDVITRFGRDALRLYELQRTVWEDFRFSWDAVEEASSTLKVAWNVFAFASLYMNLDSFNPKKWTPTKVTRNMRQEDKWLMSKTENLKATVTNALEALEIHIAARALNNFILDDLSHWYIRLVRRRFWQERDSRDKMATYVALYYALRNWLALSSPIIPFVTEKLYQTMVRPTERRSLESIHMNDWPKLESKWRNENLEEEMEIVKDVASAIAAARQSLKIKLRQPVQKTIVVTDNPKVKKAIKRLDRLVHEQANTRKIEFLSVDEEKKLEKIVAVPKYEALGPIYKAETQTIANIMKGSSGRTILDNIKKAGFHPIDIEGKQVKILASMVSFREEMPEGYSSGAFSQGRVYVEATLPKSLVQEGLVRDVVRRLQEMRRRMDLQVDRFVEVYIVCPTNDELQGLKRRQTYIKEEVRATHLELKSTTEKPIVKAELEEIWTINGKTYGMGMGLAKGKR